LGVRHPKLKKIVKIFNYALNSLISLSARFSTKNGRKIG